MLVKEALALAVLELQEFSAKQLESRILLSHILNLSQESLLLSYNEPISDNVSYRFFELIERRKNFEPIAYIIGRKEFYGLEFLVTSDVLIPRNDTELLVETVVKEISSQVYEHNQNSENIKILELGTGSGAISVSLAKNISNSSIVATDVSDKALKIATDNAKLNDVLDKISFIKSDWYEQLEVFGDSIDKIVKVTDNQDSDKLFDFIVSNPPYINVKDKAYMSKETLLYEPAIALFADDMGIECYWQIISGAHQFLKKSGKIVLELGFNQAEVVTGILKSHNFINIRTFQDLQAIDRVVIACKS